MQRNLDGDQTSMRRFARSATTIAVAVLLLGAAASPGAAATTTPKVAAPTTHRAVATAKPRAAAPVARKHAAGPRRSFDGLWSVSIFTRYGPCDASYRYPARIIGSRVLQADNDFSYQLNGVVARSGAISVTVTKGGQSATGYGRLYGARGAGVWSAAGGQCSGVWSAMRRI
jgi:hypothetical protein